MIGPEESIRLAALRERLFRCIEDELNRDGHHKSYEGALEVTLAFPCIFERSQPPEWHIVWHCYVVPEEGRHVSWKGRTLAEALAQAEAAANKIAFPYEMARFTRQDSMCRDEIENIGGGTTEGAGPDADLMIYGPSKREERRHHRSDCAIHNAPAYEPGACDCGGKP